MQRLGKAVHGRGWKLLRNDFVLWYPHVGNSVGSQQDWQGEIVAQLRGTSDGEYPLAGVIVDAKGNVYGTTETGGSSNVGTVYRVSESGKFTLLHSFDGTDGKYVYSGLVQNAKGVLFGTAQNGGSIGYGTVWKITE